MTELEMEILRYIASSNSPIDFYKVVRRFGHSGDDLPAAVKYLTTSGLINTTTEQSREEFCLAHKGSLLIGSEK